jgi:L-ascorbate metabolism protein UlaG (beta-lactamase superfamily)/glycosyltransferase involved in cell wall biosynthesis
MNHNPVSRIPVQLLGQSGCRFSFPGVTIYLDPYLSNSVQDLDAPDLIRCLPIPFAPNSVVDADIVLITHEHMDHCDPHTIPGIATASPQARFVGPAPVVRRLQEWGIASERISPALEDWMELGSELRVHAIPAAHPEIDRDERDQLRCVGYLLEYEGQCIYLAGDTSARQEIIDKLKELGPIHTAFLPVNEHNFFRARRGIIGNMSVREAFQFAAEIDARQVVAVHWDMFAVNSVEPEEIRIIHQSMKPGFNLLLRPTVIDLSPTLVSIVIRTLNEAEHLEALLQGIANQEAKNFASEVILVDSGSTDETLDIARRHGCDIHHIKREEFSFGRSLNIGCEAARGEILVMISGHCVPADKDWLQNLCRPILDDKANYIYGRQIGGSNSYFSECHILDKYFPEDSKFSQGGFFCNNANAAIRRCDWEKFRYNENLTGLEDMELAKRLIAGGGRVAYAAEACVYHYHNETWDQIKRRFEREAIALQAIMPQIHIRKRDLIRYIATSIWYDWGNAWKQGVFTREAIKIVQYRFYQYWGSYVGNNDHRKLSHVQKEAYFFPEQRG